MKSYYGKTKVISIQIKNLHRIWCAFDLTRSLVKFLQFIWWQCTDCAVQEQSVLYFAFTITVLLMWYQHTAITHLSGYLLVVFVFFLGNWRRCDDNS